MSDENVTFVGSLNISDGRHNYAVGNVLDVYGNVLGWINKPLDPTII